MRNILIAGLCAALFYAGCGLKHQEKEEQGKGTVYMVTTPLVKDTSLTREYVCQIRSVQHIELRALERGYLEKIFVDEGQFVKKGQLMFQLMPLVYNAEMQKAQAEVNFAGIEYRNTESLAEKNVVSANELALASARLDKAKAGLALARTHLQFTTIRAPFSGMMDHFHVRLGSLVNEGDLLTTLSDNSRMWVYFNVPEAEYLDYQGGQRSREPARVKLRMANNRLFGETGVVETIEADFNNETGNIAFRATFPNPGQLLRHGETGNILMSLPLKQALIIPQKATFEVLEKKYVFVVGRDHVVRQREITVEAEMPDIYVVKGGLSAGDMLLLEGLRKVSDGDRITYRYEKPATVLAGLNVYAE